MHLAAKVALGMARIHLPINETIAAFRQGIQIATSAFLPYSSSRNTLVMPHQLTGEPLGQSQINLC